jgi:hypothetical protein
LASQNSPIMPATTATSTPVNNFDSLDKTGTPISDHYQ